MDAWGVPVTRTPRPYQEAAHAELREAVANGMRRVLLVSPTGSGKTHMLSRVCAGANAKGRRIAWFAPRRELVTQAVDSLRSFGVSKSETVHVGTVQASLAKGEVPPADVVIVDEAHRVNDGAERWREIPKAYPDALVIGATATPETGSGAPLSFFQHLITVAQPRDLVEDGYLVPCTTLRPGYVLKSNALAATPVDAYLKNASGRLAIVFAPDVRRAQEMASDFRGRNVPCEAIWGDMPVEDRDRVLSDFRLRRLLVVVNVMILTEGTDIPEVSCIILARKFATAGGYIQAVGRGLRPHPVSGKVDCVLIDLPGVSHLHGDPLENRIYSLDGELGITRAVAASDRFCRVCGEVIDVAGPCENCGHENESPPIVITNDPLVKFARIRTDPVSVRVTRLAKWIKESRIKGHKDAASFYRYKGAYGAYPEREVISQAIAMASGASWCADCKHSRASCRCKGAA